MKLAVTIDVEEEGLFQGKYQSGDVPVRNVPELARLDPIFSQWGIRPTLLVTYQIIRHQIHQDLLLSLKERWSAEIGAHLHHWNTPPLVPMEFPEPVPSELMPERILEAKLENLLAAFRPMDINPASFRMGRFNLGPKMFGLLQRTGVRVDSSIAPTQRYYGGPDHRYAPSDPYFPDPEDPTRCGASRILEAPITIVPFIPGLGSFLNRLGKGTAIPEKWISRIPLHLGALPAQPMWMGLRRLKAAVLMHRKRGGEVLTIFFHSSELMPGGCPQHTTAGDVERFLEKLSSFFSWLCTEIGQESVTLQELTDVYCRNDVRSDSGHHS
ncbi:MAG: hypothetical protein WBG50_27775 [Desulfomonilaceae bacterium]